MSVCLLSGAPSLPHQRTRSPTRFYHFYRPTPPFADEARGIQLPPVPPNPDQEEGEEELEAVEEEGEEEEGEEGGMVEEEGTNISSNQL